MAQLVKRLAPRKLEPTGHSPTLSCLMSEARRGLGSRETTVQSTLWAQKAEFECLLLIYQGA